MTTELWLATGNAKKRVELERLLGGLGFRIRGLDEAALPVEIVEDGATFAANAAIKATTLARAARGLAVGDDSGLCVDALDGRPGIHSARYAGPDATDADRIAKLLGELRGVEGAKRAARFVCAICLADPSGVVAAFEADCRGTIRTTARGDGGFGYDPVFQPDEFADRRPAPSFAELTAAEKDAISHRGRALSQLAEFLSTFRSRSRP